MANIGKLALELDTLAHVLSRMPLASHKAPEAPHEARSEIVRSMVSIAERLRAALAPEPEPTRRARRPIAFGIRGVVDPDGKVREVPVVKR
jgi:hypothetical protein